MDEKLNGELHLFLGRLDGKMDMVLANQSGTNQRLDKHETRIEKLETGQAKTDAGVGTGKQIITWLFAAGALLVSLGSALKGWFH